MNAYYFLFQVLMILAFSYGALRIGKGALITAVSLYAILANLFVLKQMTLFGFHITCSDGFAVGSILCLNLLREHFGKEEAKKAINICFFFMLFFVVLSQIHLRFIPSPYDTAHFAYDRLLTPAPRLLLASIGTFYLVQQIDLRSFGWISKILPRSSFPVRSTISLTFSQMIDTLLFSFLGLYGLVANIWHIVLISFLIKTAIVFAMGPTSILFQKIRRHV